MKYLCLVYLEEQKLRAVPDGECMAFGTDLRARGQLVAGEALQPARTATTVRVRDGKASTTDGPFATLLFARQVGPAGRVFAFEPDPEHLALLTRNVAANGYGQVVCVPKAVADGNERRRLYRNPGNLGDHRIYDPADGRPWIEVDTVRLDAWFAGYEGRIDWVKMDIQGAEGLALQGMWSLLARHPRVALLMEFWPSGLRAAGAPAEALLDGLLALGFRLHHIDERRRDVRPIGPVELLAAYSPEGDGFTNLLCVRDG